MRLTEVREDRVSLFSLFPGARPLPARNKLVYGICGKVLLSPMMGPLSLNC